MRNPEEELRKIEEAEITKERELQAKMIKSGVWDGPRERFDSIEVFLKPQYIAEIRNDGHNQTSERALGD